MSIHGKNAADSNGNLSDDGKYLEGTGNSSGGATPLENKNDLQIIGLIILLVLAGFVVIQLVDAYVRKDSVIQPGDRYSSWYGATITNQTSRPISVHGDALVDTMQTVGNRMSVSACKPIIIDDAIETTVASLINGEVHINGHDEIKMNAGLYAACAFARHSTKNTHDETTFADREAFPLTNPTKLTFPGGYPLTIEP